MDIREQDVRQTVIVLPHFNYEVPLLYTRDGIPYIPIVALCKMLGLRSDTRIPRWRKLFLWANARKLPVYTSSGRKQIVWCLHLGALPFWYCCFNWKCVSSERREQLWQASSEMKEIPERVHREMLMHYRHIRRILFRLVIGYIDVDADLNQLSLTAHAVLNHEDHIWFDELIDDGRTVIHDIQAIAQRMLQEQRETLIVDIDHADHYGSVVETFSRPLLPFIRREDEEQLFECIEMLKEWYQDITTFLEERSF